MVKHILDSTDRRILGCLLSNARTPFLEIARECGVSGASIHQRVKKMEEAGIITGSRLSIDPKSLGFDVCVFIGVQLGRPDMRDKAITEIRSISEIVECHFITGRNTILLKLYCVNNEHLMNIIVNTIQNIPGVSQTETFISLGQPFPTRPVYVVEDKLQITFK